MDLILLVPFLLIPYAISAAPGFLLIRFIRRRWPSKSRMLCSVLAAGLISPAVLGFGHNLLLIPYLLSLALENQMVPSPRTWNAVLAVAVFLISMYLMRPRTT